MHVVIVNDAMTQAAAWRQFVLSHSSSSIPPPSSLLLIVRTSSLASHQFRICYGAGEYYATEQQVYTRHRTPEPRLQSQHGTALSIRGYHSS